MIKYLKKIPFIKYYLYGKNLYKNTPTIKLTTNSVVKNCELTNVQIRVEKSDWELTDNIVKITYNE